MSIVRILQVTLAAEHVCPVCGEEFNVIGHVTGDDSTVYCSGQCLFFALDQREHAKLITQMEAGQ